MFLNKLTLLPLTLEVREVKNAKLTPTYHLDMRYMRPVVDFKPLSAKDTVLPTRLGAGNSFVEYGVLIIAILKYS